MEHLAVYLDQHGITQSAFAGSLGTTQATISKFCRGVTRPSLDMAVKIERATGGSVPVASWVSDTVDVQGAA